MALLVVATVSEQPQSIEVLIPEARQRTRRRRIRKFSFLFSAALAIAVVALGVSGIVGTSTSRTHQTSEQQRSQPLAVGTHLGASSVVALQMFNTSNGVGVSDQWTNPGSSAKHSYLTETTSSGVGWRVLGQLPVPSSNPLILFVNATQGYVADGQNLIFTRNGGRSWSRVSIAGPPESLTRSGESIWVTSNSCLNQITQTGQCTTILNVVQPGSLRPSSARPIPSMPAIALTRSLGFMPKLTTILLAQISPSSGLVAEGLDGPNSLLRTTDAGRRWSQLSNPCGQITIGKLVALGTRQWEIFCSRSGGMNHATNRLYATSNAGQSWRLVAYGNPWGSNVGALGGDSLGNFNSSANGRYLWFTTSLGFIFISTNGGRTWSHPLLGGTEGWDWGGFVSVGSSGWLALANGGIFRTTNGLTWSQIASK